MMPARKEQRLSLNSWSCSFISFSSVLLKVSGSGITMARVEIGRCLKRSPSVPNAEDLVLSLAPVLPNAIPVNFCVIVSKKRD